MPRLFRHSTPAHIVSSTDRDRSSPSRFSPLPLDVPTLTFSRSRSRAPIVNSGVKNSRSQDHYKGYDEHAGAEPGVNPRSGESIAEYGHLKQECEIEVMDYDCDEMTSHKFTNEGLISFLKERSPGLQADDVGPPRTVRWINIVGIDWGVLSAIALKYSLHSLALEDILHERGHTHTKADYYPNHLFLRILCHSLEQKGDGTRSSGSPTANGTKELDRNPSPEFSDPEFKKQLDLEEGGISLLPNIRSSSGSENTIAATKITAPRSASPLDSQDSNVKGKGRSADGAHPKIVWSSSLQKRFTNLSGFGGPARERKKLQIRAITQGDRVFVNHEPMFIFLLRDGTVISIHPTLSLDYTSPIAQRLKRADSVLRTSEDSSLLVESLLDLIVDRVLEVVDEYQVKINNLEHDILLHPIMKSVRSLHILSGDLILHKRTLEPVRTMIYGLRRYDLERCRALADDIAIESDHASETEVERAEGEKPADTTDGKRTKAKTRRRRREGANEPSIDHLQREQFRRQGKKIVGHFSYKAKVYLADVNDHMDFAITSLDMFSGISENLINYAFNIASYEMNIVMNRLTMATIIFLPLTLLTGYFVGGSRRSRFAATDFFHQGMNFARMWSVEQNSDALYVLPVVSFEIF
ncbi:hypothetical protein GALMADRAFT_234391 [Galerina marginata CBS 339.88]|uniref:Magnesium transporter n=1 Tax=Galerina marginata (strain CBS 339.88) TaxID=685588 RepID=A0A067TZR3_GALM3|nr:hypothetical protein GALMADRAFT_234391 [Galerina marginata CBS 339.88]